jgi:Protein of unknown function (DUF2929)
MHFIWTFIWTFLLAQMMTYVISSMNNTHFDFMTGTIVSIALTIILYVFPPLLSTKDEGEHSH